MVDMRDINRIPKTLNRIGILWSEYLPDIRLGQFMNILQGWSGNDLFYLEEDELIELMVDFIAEKTSSEEMTRQQIKEMFKDE